MLLTSVFALFSIAFANDTQMSNTNESSTMASTHESTVVKKSKKKKNKKAKKNNGSSNSKKTKKAKKSKKQAAPAPAEDPMGMSKDAIPPADTGAVPQ
jgi:hypothetical protein